MLLLRALSDLPLTFVLKGGIQNLYHLAIIKHPIHVIKYNQFLGGGP